MQDTEVVVDDWTIRHLGCVTYTEGLEYQEDARRRVIGGAPDELLFLEHDSVVTLGKRGGAVDARRLHDLAIPVIQVDRGGQATWHGPGQIVGYPIVNLRRRKVDVTSLVAHLGFSMADAARGLGVRGVCFDAARPGVYLDGRKLGSIGLHIHRGVSTHGFSLNVSCDLSGFEAIETCGQPGLKVTTLSAEAGRAIAVADVLPLLEERIIRLGKNVIV
jgi:lipoyl(octanoyl) transferase